MAFEFLDEFDVLAKWPQDKKGLLESKKWNERVESLQALQDLIQDHPRLAANVSYSDLVTKLKMILIKDMNVNVVSNAIKVITGLIQGLRQCFDPYVSGLAPVLFEKFKEQKEVVKAPLINCTEALIEFCNVEKLPQAMDEALKKPHPSVKLQLNLLVYKILTHFSPQQRPVAFVKGTTEADANVRDASYSAIGAMVRLLGENATRTITDGAQWNDDKIKESLEKANQDAEKWAAEHCQTSEEAGNSPSQPTTQASSSDQQVCAEPVAAMDPWDLMEPANVMKHLPATFDEYLSSKKWQERKEALEALLAALEKNPKLVPDIDLYRQLLSDLKKVIEKDTNVNVVSLAVKSVHGLVHGLRGKFEPALSPIFLSLIAKSKEKKEVFVDPFLKCIDEIATYMHLSSFSALILTALSNQNPQTRKQFLQFVSRIFNRLNQKTAPKDQVKELAPKLVELTSDATPDVRDACYEAIGSITRCIGDAASDQLFKDVLSDQLKKSKVDEKRALADKEFGQALSPDMAKIYSATNSSAPSKPAQSRPKPSSASTSARRQSQPARVSSAQPIPKRATPVQPTRPNTATKPIKPNVVRSGLSGETPKPGLTGPISTSRPAAVRSAPRLSAPRPNVVRAPQLSAGTPYRAPTGVSKIDMGRNGRPAHVVPVGQPPKSSSIMTIARKPLPKPANDFYSQRSISNLATNRALPAKFSAHIYRGLQNGSVENGLDRAAVSQSNPGSRQSSQTRIDLVGSRPSKLRPPTGFSRR